VREMPRHRLGRGPQYLREVTRAASDAPILVSWRADPLVIGRRLLGVADYSMAFLHDGMDEMAALRRAAVRDSGVRRGAGEAAQTEAHPRQARPDEEEEGEGLRNR